MNWMGRAFVVCCCFQPILADAEPAEPDVQPDTDAVADRVPVEIALQLTPKLGLYCGESGGPECVVNLDELAELTRAQLTPAADRSIAAVAATAFTAKDLVIEHSWMVVLGEPRTNVLVVGGSDARGGLPAEFTAFYRQTDAGFRRIGLVDSKVDNIATTDTRGDGGRHLLAADHWVDTIEGCAAGTRLLAFKLSATADSMIQILETEARSIQCLDYFGDRSKNSAMRKTSLRVVTTGSTRLLEGTRSWSAGRFAGQATTHFRWNEAAAGGRLEETGDATEQAKLRKLEAAFDAEKQRIITANQAAMERKQALAEKQTRSAALSRIPVLVQSCASLHKRYGELQATRRRLEQKGDLQGIERLVPSLRATEKQYNEIGTKLRAEFQALVSTGPAPEVIQAARRSIVGTCGVTLP